MQPWLVRFMIPREVPILGGQDLSIPVFFILATLGYVVASFAMVREAEREGVNPRPLLDLSVAFLFLALIGGRLGFVFLSDPGFFLKNPGLLFDLWHGGMSFWGGFLLCAIAGVLFARRIGVDALSLGDLFAPALSLGLVFGWAGALASGSGFGKPIDFPLGWELPWGVVFYNGQVPEVLRGIPLHPTQVYLALFNLALFLGLTRLRGRQAFPGQVTLVWLGVYCVGTFALEAFRYDFDRGVFAGGWLSAPQIAALILLPIAGVLYGRRRAKKGADIRPLAAPGSPLAG